MYKSDDTLLEYSKKGHRLNLNEKIPYITKKCLIIKNNLYIDND